MASRYTIKQFHENVAKHFEANESENRDISWQTRSWLNLPALYQLQVPSLDTCKEFLSLLLQSCFSGRNVLYLNTLLPRNAVSATHTEQFRGDWHDIKQKLQSILNEHSDAKFDLIIFCTPSIIWPLYAPFKNVMKSECDEVGCLLRRMCMEYNCPMLVCDFKDMNSDVWTDSCGEAWTGQFESIVRLRPGGLLMYECPDSPPKIISYPWSMSFTK